jgi:hypothetical protein
MTDKELLELAAKASGIALEIDDDGFPCYWGEYRGMPQKEMWNPLEYDGDTFRLAAQLRMFENPMYCRGFERAFNEENEVDEYAPVRRYIVRAAAEIGKQKE